MTDSSSHRDHTLRGALVGYGFIGGRGHAPAYVERAKRLGDVELVAVADVCPARRDAARRDLPGVRVYESHEALLAVEGSRLDFLDVATPPCDHATIAAAGLAAGLHVLCEKPLTTSLDSARELAAQALRAKRVLFPCHNYRHAPVVRAIREVVESGTVGEITAVTLQTFRTLHAKGVAEWRPDWRRDRRTSGGGIAMDHGSHSLYLMFEWLGGHPTAVSARAFNRAADRWDTEDNLGAVLTFPRGVAQMHLTWTAGVRKVIYTLQGTRGAITVDDDAMQIATLGADGQPGPVEQRDVASHWMDASHVTWFDSLFGSFRGAIEAGDWVGADARDALKCVETICAMYASSAEGGREIKLRTDATTATTSPSVSQPRLQ